MSDAHRATETATEDWAGANGARWAAKADRMEAQLEPVNDVLFAAAALQPGETVIDVGCGRGVTTRVAAELVASDGAPGSVVGLDVSDELLVLAAEMTDPGLPIRWQTADAQRTAFAATADAVISRFGVMFFDDPAAAFANLRTAVRPGGRLCLAVWPTLEHVEMMQLLIDMAVRTAADHGEQLVPPPTDTGPFSLGHHERTRQVLAGAGWDDVSIGAHDLVLYSGGPGPVAEVAAASMDMGLLRATFDQASPAVADAARAAIVEEFARRHDGTGVPLPARVLIVQAVNPG